jgi:hypothetical protein
LMLISYPSNRRSNANADSQGPGTAIDS